jgi:hypothetical protein
MQRRFASLLWLQADALSPALFARQPAGGVWSRGASGCGRCHAALPRAHAWNWNGRSSWPTTRRFRRQAQALRPETTSLALAPLNYNSGQCWVAISIPRPDAAVTHRRMLKWSLERISCIIQIKSARRSTPHLPGGLQSQDSYASFASIFEVLLEKK